MDLKDLAPVAIVFLIVIIVLGIGSDITQEVRDQSCGTWNASANPVTDGTNFCSDATNGSNLTYLIGSEGLDSLQTLSEWLPTIALIIAAVIVITTVGYFRMKN